MLVEVNCLQKRFYLLKKRFFPTNEQYLKARAPARCADKFAKYLCQKQRRVFFLWEYVDNQPQNLTTHNYLAKIALSKLWQMFLSLADIY